MKKNLNAPMSRFQKPKPFAKAQSISTTYLDLALFQKIPGRFVSASREVGRAEELAEENKVLLFPPWVGGTTVSWILLRNRLESAAEVLAKRLLLLGTSAMDWTVNSARNERQLMDLIVLNRLCDVVI